MPESMDMYWRISSFLELQHLSEEDRARLLREHLGWRTPTLVVVRSVFFGLLLASFVGVGTARLLSLPTSTAFWFSAGYLLVFATAIYQFQLIWIRGALRVFLEEHAEVNPLPLCINCGYNVHGLVSNRCPECGHTLQRLS